MKQQISWKRHGSISDHDREFRQDLLLFFGAELVPARQVHVASALSHVVLDHPRHWRDVTIPWPFGALRMAILTRLLDDSADGTVDSRTSEERFRRYLSLHRAKRMHKDRSEQEQNRRTQQRSYKVSSHVILSCWINARKQRFHRQILPCALLYSD